MSKKILPFFIFIFIFHFTSFFSQTNVQDTLYLMNGQVVGEKVLDTLLGAVTIANNKKPGKNIHYELDQLYMVRFSGGVKRFYYMQDTLIYNWFTRDEMWMYMKGQNDARRGFKARGSLIGAGIAGLIGGMTGTFWAPVAPYGYMAMVGLPKVRIRHNTISNPNYIDSDHYISGYERVARHKRRIQAIIGGTIGLVVGYTFYGLFHNKYPETINIGFK
jgi:hypothetical protein